MEEREQEQPKLPRFQFLGSDMLRFNSEIGRYWGNLRLLGCVSKNLKKMVNSNIFPFFNDVFRPQMDQLCEDFFLLRRNSMSEPRILIKKKVSKSSEGKAVFFGGPDQKGSDGVRANQDV